MQSCWLQPSPPAGTGGQGTGAHRGTGPAIYSYNTGVLGLHRIRQNLVSRGLISVGGRQYYILLVAHEMRLQMKRLRDWFNALSRIPCVVAAGYLTHFFYRYDTRALLVHHNLHFMKL